MNSASSNFLVNLAIIKINWDVRQDILHNFMPLVGYAISQLDHDIVSVTELKEKIAQVAQFRIPSGALEVLIRRACRTRYGYVVREDKTFRRVPEKIILIEFEKHREIARKLFSHISESFSAFCKTHFPHFETPDTSDALFEVLYEVAPRLVGSAAAYIDTDNNVETGKSPSLRYRASRFIRDAVDSNADYLTAIESFFKGAVLAESFYYTSPDSVQHKFRDVRVFYDTNLLSKILGYSSPAEVEAARELHQIVTDSRAKVCIFEHTASEFRGIFSAAAYARRHGPLKPRRPGDVFDWLNNRGYSLSDIELEIVKIPNRLEELKIRVEVKGPLEHEIELGEKELKAYILDEIPRIDPQALDNDVDSLAGVFRIRRGRAQPYLEACRAIFVTTNTSLARASTLYFNQEHAVSDAPVCITDHVFCMLLWLKTVDKKKDLSRELMVANCIAALQPDRELWSHYMLEVDRLEARGDVTAADYALLAHSLEARQALMDITLGDPDTYVIGNAMEVLEAAKKEIVAESKEKIIQSEANLTKALDDLTDATTKLTQEQGRRQDDLDKITHRLAVVIYVTFSSAITIFLGIIMWETLNVEGFKYFTSEFKIQDIASTKIVPYVCWLLVFVMSVVNAMFGWAIASPARALSRIVAERITGWSKNSRHLG